MPVTMEQIEASLKSRFGEGNIISQWHIETNSSDSFDPIEMYHPRPDFIVKPVNVDTNITQNNEQIDNVYIEHTTILNYLKMDQNINFEFNTNPRCFIAIECEDQNISPKYLIGSIINASALGKVGIVVAMNEEDMSYW